MSQIAILWPIFAGSLNVTLSPACPRTSTGPTLASSSMVATLSAGLILKHLICDTGFQPVQDAEKTSQPASQRIRHGLKAESPCHVSASQDTVLLERVCAAHAAFNRLSYALFAARFPQGALQDVLLNFLRND